MSELENIYASDHLFNFATALKAARANEKLSKDDTHRVPGADVDVYRLLGKDLMDCLFEGGGQQVWDKLEWVYKQAWFNEIKRRLKGRELCLLNSKKIG